MESWAWRRTHYALLHTPYGFARRPNRTHQSDHHTPDTIELFKQYAELRRSEQPEISSEQQIVLQLLARAQRDSEESRELRPVLGRTFGDVRRDGLRAPKDLGAKPGISREF